ncbi:hypothetical protein MUN88_12745 [Gracilibacillus caseinilyticus]|uniref:Uncharacterized protein n=1 Tax=Gracilibacillus caseinilyticus TaxID=2932256 RepID=A0ABY4ER97_9BACI|nr:hypothetical protein [Gracilibacillus caseinilyticus]UOQ46957.1 hypothetical protein MUN88_12745 [Gracilibacillus caseinilyticus]
MRNIQWLPVLGSIGIGVAAYNMMNSQRQGRQIQKLITNATDMTNQEQR